MRKNAGLSIGKFSIEPTGFRKPQSVVTPVRQVRQRAGMPDFVQAPGEWAQH
jgi:hypothetical protein